eukprot:3782122-Amphidinium_carterae.1
MAAPDTQLNPPDAAQQRRKSPRDGRDPHPLPHSSRNLLVWAACDSGAEQAKQWGLHVRWELPRSPTLESH